MPEQIGFGVSPPRFAGRSAKMCENHQTLETFEKAYLTPPEHHLCHNMLPIQLFPKLAGFLDSDLRQLQASHFACRHFVAHPRERNPTFSPSAASPLVPPTRRSRRPGRSGRRQSAGPSAAVTAVPGEPSFHQRLRSRTDGFPSDSTDNEDDMD